MSSFLHFNCSCVILQAFSFMRLSLMLCRCDAEWYGKWLYNNTFLKVFSLKVNVIVRLEFELAYYVKVVKSTIHTQLVRGRIRPMKYSYIKEIDRVFKKNADYSNNIVVFGWVLWRINNCRLFNDTYCSYIYIKYIYVTIPPPPPPYVNLL